MWQDIFEKPKLLIVVELPEPDALAMPLLETFKGLQVIVLGHWCVSEQTSPEQAREEFKDEAEEALETVIQQFEHCEVELERELVFTGDIAETVEQIIEEQDCDAVLSAGPAEEIGNILVPIHRADQQPALIADFIAGLVGEDTAVTLLRYPESDEDLADDWAIGYFDRFTDSGIPEDQLRTDVREDVDVVEDVLDCAEDYDLIVIGECRPTVKERIFGEVHDKIVRKAPCPVIVVVRKSEEQEAAAEARNKSAGAEE